jgi:hypothetical protein
MHRDWDGDGDIAVLGSSGVERSHMRVLYTATLGQSDQQCQDQNTKNSITNYTNYHQK